MSDLPNALNSEQTNPILSNLLRLFPQAFKTHSIEGKPVYATSASLPLPDSTGVVFDLIVQDNQPILVMRDKDQARAQLNKENLLSLINQTTKYAATQLPVESRLFKYSVPQELLGSHAVPCYLDSPQGKEEAMTQVLDMTDPEQLDFIKSLLSSTS